MRVKDFKNKLVRIACSPSYPPYIACATADQQTFGTNLTLDLLQIDIGNQCNDLDIVKSINIESK